MIVQMESRRRSTRRTLCEATMAVAALGLSVGCQNETATKTEIERTEGPATATTQDVTSGELPAPKPAAAPSTDASTLPIASYPKIVHVGDSTVGYTQGLQLELKKIFDPLGIAYESHTLTSAGLRTIAKSRIVAKLVEEKKPDLVIIQLGTNNLTVPTPSAFAPAIADIVAQVGDRPCYWIGPIPLEQKEHGMRAFLRENVAPCRFYDSFDLKLERQSDHIHPTQRAAKKWAQAFLTFTETTPPGRALQAVAP